MTVSSKELAESVTPLETASAGRLKQWLIGGFRWDSAEEMDSVDVRSGELHDWTVGGGRVRGSGPIEAHIDETSWSVVGLSVETGLATNLSDLMQAEVGGNVERLRQSMSDNFAGKLFWRISPQSALVAYHSQSRTLCLFRDTLGFVPIYYRLRDEGVELSTSLPMLLETTGETSQNTSKLSELITFGHHYGSETVWSSVRVVPPGQCVVLSPGQRPARHWFARPAVAFDPAERARLSSMTKEQLISEARELVDDSLQRCIKGKSCVVQGGGGVDSSVLTALSAKSRPDIVSWSINHPDLAHSEKSWVQPLMERLNVDARFADIRRGEFVVNLVDVSARSAQPIIGPNFIGGAILRQRALEEAQGDVHFLNGELCDTIFGGLSTFHQLAFKRRLMRGLRRAPARLRRVISRSMLDDQDWLCGRIVALPESEIARSAMGSLERAELLDEVAAVGSGSSDRVQALADRLTWLDIRRVPCALHHGFYERDEWYGGHFLFPFADRALLRFGFNLPFRFKFRRGHTKWLWRHLAADLIGKDAAFRPKKGFDAPINVWLRPILGLLDGGFVADAFQLSSAYSLTSLARREDLLWPLANIELWGRLHRWRESPESLVSKLMSD